MNTQTDHRSEPLVAPDSIADWLEAIPEPIAITGGTGFVGSHLVDLLCVAGRRPRILVRSPEAPRWIAGREVEWVSGSMSDSEALQRLVAEAGTVIHLAAVTRAPRSGDFDAANRLGTVGLVEAVRDRAPAARLVLLSSLSAAGPAPTPAGVGPETEARPVSAYGRSKLDAEAAVRELGDGFWWTILRPPAIFGPRDTDVFEFFKMAALGWMSALRGERWITLAHAADVVRAVVAAAAAGEAGRLYHLGEPEPFRLDDLMRRLAALGGVRARLLRVPSWMVGLAGAASGAVERLGLARPTLTPDKARELVAGHWCARTEDSLAALGVVTTVPFDEGARDAWAWYRGQGWLR